MILSDREINSAIERGLILIKPLPDRKLWTSTAIDLTLDKTIRKWKEPRRPPTGHPDSVRPHSPGFDIKELVYSDAYTETIEIDQNGYELTPGSFVLVLVSHS
jgi:deoxycytidine triphosphate deaminase